MDSTTYVIALYIRLSTEDSKVGSCSIESQRKLLHKYVDSMEDIRNPDVREFVDNGYSGTNFERPAVQELLDLVRSGGVNCIMVKDFTRFGRNAIEVGYFMEMVFPLYGIRFISLGDEFDSAKYHGDTGGINVAFKYLISEFYSQDLSMKYRSAKYVKFRRGEYQSKNCPYGYLKGTNGRMEPNEETATNVRLIFELAQKGRTTNQIVKVLFERGIPTPAEYKAAHGFTGHDISRCCHIWQKSSVLNILKDERYTGTYIVGKREVTEVGSHRVRLKDETQWIKIPDHHPAIVSRETYEQVRARLTRPQCVKRGRRTYPLRCKVFCGCCRHAMQRATSKNHAFFCGHTIVDENALCHRMRISEAELEAMLYDILSKQAQVILNVDDLSSSGKLDIQLAEQAESAKRVEACLEQKRELYEQFVLREITVEDYKKQKIALDGELERVRQLHAVVTAQTERIQKEENEKISRTNLAQEVTRTKGLTAGLVDLLIERIFVYPDNHVEIIWKTSDFCGENVSSK